jgi:hypothetical protein
MRTNATSKYGFRIRTRTGLILDRLLIHARDAAEATRKLEQMYPYCRVLECRPPVGPPTTMGAELAAVVALVTRRRVAA